MCSTTIAARMYVRMERRESLPSVFVVIALRVPLLNELVVSPQVHCEDCPQGPESGFYPRKGTRRGLTSRGKVLVQF